MNYDIVLLKQIYLKFKKNNWHILRLDFLVVPSYSFCIKKILTKVYYTSNNHKMYMYIKKYSLYNKYFFELNISIFIH